MNIYCTTELIKVGSKKKDVDFSDILILEKSKSIISKKNDSFDGLYSFDKTAQQIDNIFKSLKKVYSETTALLFNFPL